MFSVYVVAVLHLVFTQHRSCLNTLFVFGLLLIFLRNVTLLVLITDNFCPFLSWSFCLSFVYKPNENFYLRHDYKMAALNIMGLRAVFGI